VDSSQKKAWYNSLPEYLGMPALADIPAGSRPRPGDSSIWFAPGSQPREDLSQEMFYFGYGMNKFLQTGISGRTARVTAMPHASQIVFLTQNESFVPWADPQEIPASTGLSNVLFCDGHVETISAAGTEK
jgi:prepilin-type processing-associated H-X9-DG protein